MKKTKKLSLNRETIRRMSDAETGAVNGGGTLSKAADCTTTDGVGCASNHPVSCTGQTHKTVEWC